MLLVGMSPTLTPPRLWQADIILKYDGDEARSLKTYGELPDTVQINAGAETLEGEEFGDDSALMRQCTNRFRGWLEPLLWASHACLWVACCRRLRLRRGR